jgi:hypothetical protein
MTTTIYKQLATQQDLALGSGTVVQERNGVEVTVDKIDINLRFATLATLQAATVENGLHVMLTERADAVYLISPVGTSQVGGDILLATNQVAKLVIEGVINAKWLGAVGDGATDDTLALQAAIDATEAIPNGKLVIPSSNYVISSLLTVTSPIIIDGQLSQIYQSTANIGVIRFDKGSTLGGNYQNTFDVRNLIVRTAVGTGNGFIFRNTNESYFENLYVVGCGNIAFDIQGCLLSEWNHCYVGNGLTASPGFFISGASGNVTGFKTTDYEGLSSNTNTFIRCSATNSTAIAFDITGTGNVFISPDMEGINTPAIGFAMQGLSTTITGGNFEGTGASIEVTQSNCTIQGINALGFVNIRSGIYGTSVIGGNIKYLNFVAGSFNNTAIGVRIGTGGSLIDNGTSNLLLNIYNFNTMAEAGSYREGPFIPILKFGAAAGVSAYAIQKGYWWRNGNTMNFTLHIEITSLSAATGTATIDLNDIPFLSAGNIDVPCSSYLAGLAIGAGYTAGPRLDAGTKNIKLNKVLDTTGAVLVMTEAEFSAGDQLLITGFYPVSGNA